jgi:hypothetical protein
MAKTKKQKAQERAKKEAKEDKKEKKSSKKSSSSSSSDKLKKELKEAGVWDTYKNMSSEQQEFIAYNYKIGKSDSKEDIKIYQEALDEATKQADPYWKSYLLVAQDEVQRSVDEAIKTTESEVEKNQRLIDSLKENLASNKDYLSLEQQSDLATLAQNYEVNQENLVQGAADTGLTFSTKRKIAEQRLAESQTGMVESTTRKYNKQIRDLETEAARGNTEAQKEIEELQRKLSSNITSIGREAEAKLGSENLPAISGYTALGDVSGDLYEQKTKDIAERQQAIYDEKSMSSLNLSSL